MGNKDWFVDSGTIAQGSAGQSFEGIHYFQSMCLHKESFGAIVQINVESITEKFENIGTVVSSKLTELRKPPSPALVEEISKFKAFEGIKQYIVSTIVQSLQFAPAYGKCRRKRRGKLLKIC